MVGFSVLALTMFRTQQLSTYVRGNNQHNMHTKCRESKAGGEGEGGRGGVFPNGAYNRMHFFGL